MKPSAKTPADTSSAADHAADAAAPEAPAAAPAEAPPESDALDHDGDGRMGGVAPSPARQPMVVLKDVDSLGLAHGEVIQVTPADAKGLLAKDQARNATEAEVELAQPRVRDWPT
jgi:hypothetical protein